MVQRVDKGVEIGTRVLVRSNEDEPIRIGTLVDWFDAYGKWSEAIPVILIEDKRYFAGGIVLVYAPELIQELEGLTPKQQWDLLCSRLFENKDYSG